MCRSRACHLIPDILSFQRARFVFAAESQASYLRTLRSRAREALPRTPYCRASRLERLGIEDPLTRQIANARGAIERSQTPHPPFAGIPARW